MNLKELLETIRRAEVVVLRLGALLLLIVAIAAVLRTAVAHLF
jgi:hypothetical protein